MLFGQETNDWHGAYSSIKAPLEEMNKYKTFWIDKRSDYSNVGVLMQTFNNLQKDFDDVCFVWNNIIKIGKTGKGTPKDLIDWQKNWFDITKKEIELMKLLVLAWIIAATLGGCVISLNIQKNNNNSDQKVDQNASANQENDSTMFNLKMN